MRTKRSFVANRRRKRVLASASGFRQGSRGLFRMAKQRVERSLVYRYKSRRLRKRAFSSLWKVRLNNGFKFLSNDLNYCSFVRLKKEKQLTLNDKWFNIKPSALF